MSNNESNGHDGWHGNGAGVVFSAHLSSPSTTPQPAGTSERQGCNDFQCVKMFVCDRMYVGAKLEAGH